MTAAEKGIYKRLVTASNVGHLDQTELNLQSY